MNPGPWRFALVGQPVAHSLSPRLHHAALRALGVEGSYTLLECSPRELAAVVDRLRAGELQGLNVTIPHKERVLEHCDRCVGAAAHIGAVNTLVRAPDGVIEGHNTDVIGLKDALLRRWPSLPWRGQPATLIGAGGAARAALLTAMHLGVSEVRVVNRNHARAERLVRELEASVDLDVRACQAQEAFAESALVLQASAAGMGWRDDSESWRDCVSKASLALRHVAPSAALFDLVYRPSITPWMVAARNAGLESEGGLGMLVAQAAAAFSLWTGAAPPLDEMLAGLC